MKYLAIIAFLFVSVFPIQAQAETAVSKFCLNKTSKTLSWPDINNICPASAPAITPSGVSSNFKAVCILEKKDGSFSVVNSDSNTAGTSQNCDKYKNDSATYASATLVTSSQVSGTPPSGTTTQTPTTQTPTTTTTPTKPTTTSQTPVPSNSGDCPSGFTAKGPLCIPDNPFEKDGGIAGQGTFGELATTIINILLYIAGIVAVIMIIIGGFIWMTARGNEAQAVSGRKTLINALIGLIIVILAYAIVQAVTNFIIKGTGT